MNNIAVAIPPHNEQLLIIQYLNKKTLEIDSLIKTIKITIEEYKKLKQSIITEAVTKGIRKNRPMKDSGIEWIGKIPNDWETVKIKWLLSERNERSEEGLEEPLSMSQKFGLIPTKEMDTIPNIASSFIDAKIVHIGDLVFNKLKAHLGVFAVSNYYGLTSPDYAVYVPIGNINTKYLEYLFKCPHFINEFKKKSSGVGAGLTRLYTSDLFSLYCLYPPLSEQNEIVDYLKSKCEEIDSIIKDREMMIKELEDYKKSIIYEYVTGKREIPEASSIFGE